MVPSAIPCGRLFPKIGVRNPLPKLELLLSQEQETTDFQIWLEYSKGPSEQKPIKNLGEKGAWAYPMSMTVQFLDAPYYLKEEVKLRTSNFVRIL